MKMMRPAIAGVVAFVLTTPAAATVWLVTATGQTNAGNGPLMGVPFGNAPVTAAFLIRGDRPGTPLPPIGGTGTATRYDGATIGFFLAVGPWQVSLTDASLRAAFVLDNGSPSPMQPTVRADQFSLSEGFVFNGSTLVPHLATDAPLAPNTFLSSFNFGRSATAAGSDPTLIEGSGFPDLEPIFGQGGFIFMTLIFRQGVATNPIELSRLPTVTFSTSLSSLDVQRVTLVPEPASWALMIAGFGLVGAAIRRRGAFATGANGRLAA